MQKQAVRLTENIRATESIEHLDQQTAYGGRASLHLARQADYSHCIRKPLILQRRHERFFIGLKARPLLVQPDALHRHDRRQRRIINGYIVIPSAHGQV